MAACLSVHTAHSTRSTGDAHATRPGVPPAPEAATSAGAPPSARSGECTATKTPGAIADLAPERFFARETFLTLEGVRQWGAALLRRLEEVTLQDAPQLTREVVARLARGLYARGGEEVTAAAAVADDARGGTVEQEAESEDEWGVSDGEGGVGSADDVEAAALGEDADPVEQRSKAQAAASMRSGTHAERSTGEEARRCVAGDLERGLGPYTHITNMLLELDAAGQLPVIVFHLVRAGCTRRALAIAGWLKACLARSAGQTYAELLEEQEELRERAAQARRELADAKAGGGKKLAQEKAEAMQDAITEVEARIKPPLSAYPSCTFASLANLTPQADHFVAKLRRSDWATATPKNRALVEALDFGVAVHHAGVSIKYRRAAEVLFRCGKVRVLFATGTLAQGLNMPARTVAFDGDSDFLNPITYQQMAGRAGRRGFDVAGRVVFCRSTPERVAALACAAIAPARGTLMLSAPNTLRVLGASMSPRDLAALLTQPLAEPVAPVAMCQLRQTLFLCNAVLLRQRQLLKQSFHPTGLSPLVGHLHYHAFSAVLFLVDLIETGVLWTALRAVPSMQQPARLLELLACVFNRMPLRRDTVLVGRSDAVSGMLPPLRQLSPSVHATLSRSNALTLQILVAHLRDAAAAQQQQQRAVVPCSPRLPFSGTSLDAWGGSERGRAAVVPCADERPEVTLVRSSFSARFELGDMFESAAELEEATEASLQGMAGEAPLLPLDVPLSSYAVVFYKGSAGCSGLGGFKAAIAACGFREDEVYALLKDWTVLLACLAAACRGRDLEPVTARLSRSFSALFDSIGYV